MVQALSRAGSYLDGGASHVLQDAAVPLLKPDLVKSEFKALQQHFVKKRDFVVARYDYFCLYCSSLVLTGLDRLNEMGLKVNPPDATFYIWVNCISTFKVQNSNLVSELPEAIHSGLSFFEACLEEKVIIVPGMCHNSDAASNLELGLFFDINPKNRRDLSHSPCHHFIRYNST